ncbi:hypothetical protein GALMADRAFT_262796 [Galerina marginata CBS 339.88]|uniref:ABM domain-containing protein n=1 Tax=Galerina marginata (strain CBS 339.88) TaxID=685588 RepID=A0A067TN62_GALM3|nr:hypothetical protein GALMADRAFT_262796 [Galerina marginata CBS 339.88]
MPILDIIAFNSTEEPKASSVLKSFLDDLKKYDGVISAWHGVQVEGPAHYHILVFWDSLAQLKAASKESYYPSLPTTLPILESSLLRRLFEINQFPEAALTAPVTDMSYMSLKENFVFENDLQPILVRFTQLKETGALGAYWGHSPDVKGLSVILVGWKCVQDHHDAPQIPAYKELVLSAMPVVNFDLKFVPFEKIF